MKVIDWLFSIENKTVWITGNNSIIDLRLAIHGFMEAERLYSGNNYNPFYPGFAKFVEKSLGLTEPTASSWARTIMDRSENNEVAMKTFYKLLREYVESDEFMYKSGS